MIHLKNKNAPIHINRHVNKKTTLKFNNFIKSDLNHIDDKHINENILQSPSKGCNEYFNHYVQNLDKKHVRPIIQNFIKKLVNNKITNTQ